MAVSVQESDVHAGISEGGRISSAFVVSRETDNGREFMAYIQPSWLKYYAPLRTWRARSERTYRDLGRLFSLLRDDFDFKGPITVYLRGDPALRRKRGVQAEDLSDG